MVERSALEALVTRVRVLGEVALSENKSLLKVLEDCPCSNGIW